MMATLALLENEVQYMRCTLCDKFLSVPPIIRISDDGTENQCGRCQHVKSDISKRNVCYENLARFLHFPCIYRNCPEQLQWNEVEKHEKTCVHKTIQCPLYYQKNCKTTIEVNELELHMNRLHRSNIIHGDTISKEIILNMSSVYYLKIDEGHFLVYITPDVIFVGSLGPLRKYTTYTVKMTANNCKEKSLVFDYVGIAEFEERKHCYRCLKEKCSIHYKKDDDKNNPDYLYIDKDLLTRFAGDTARITVSLTLVPKTEVVEETDQSLAAAFNHNSIMLKRYFRCALCCEYMTGQVFRCTAGHMFCGQCEDQVKDCNMCSRKTHRSRCQVAEDIASSIILCCSGEGCEFIGSLHELTVHERHCCAKSKY